MEIIFLAVILIILLAGIAGIFWFLKSGRKPEENNQSLLLLQNQIQEVVRTLDSKLG
ncbi:MAG: hypothetical protein AAB496_01905 [Patescibacteria group bacterium]